MDPEEVQEMVDKALAEQQRKYAQQFKQSTLFSRNIKVDQMKATFKNPADKRAIGYLVDEEFDWKDFRIALSEITEDDQLLDVNNHREKFRNFGEFCLKFANMRSRKNSREMEAYQVANRSQYGWMTEKFYRQGELFAKDSDVWYENDELTADKKLSMLRNAEREAKYALVIFVRVLVSLGSFFPFFSKGSPPSRPSMEP